MNISPFSIHCMHLKDKCPRKIHPYGFEIVKEPILLKMKKVKIILSLFKSNRSVSWISFKHSRTLVRQEHNFKPQLDKRRTQNSQNPLCLKSQWWRREKEGRMLLSCCDQQNPFVMIGKDANEKETTIFLWPSFPPFSPSMVGKEEKTHKKEVEEKRVREGWT